MSACHLDLLISTILQPEVELISEISWLNSWVEQNTWQDI
uniref:Uncharacterized protein n=1 Tax=Anguilla anguilla TaxID=7936 RepID=A0A0E9TYV9_ANGAN